MKLQESGEMYLENILVLSQTREHVRAIDVAERMGFSKPSVSRAMGLLKNGGYIETDSNGYLLLTRKGHELASKIYERHLVISRLLEYIGVDREVAEEDACRVEHVISDQTFSRIKEFSGKLPK